MLARSLETMNIVRNGGAQTVTTVPVIKRDTFLPKDKKETKEPGQGDLQKSRAGRGVGSRNLSHQGIQVVRFHVWQDLTAELDDGMAPLHATLTLEMTNEWYQSLSKPGGTIRIETLQDADVVEAKLLVYQAHYGLGLGQPGSKQMQFMMSPSPLCSRLGTNESVKGSAKIKFMDRQVTIPLPETPVIFTR